MSKGIPAIGIVIAILVVIVVFLLTQTRPEPEIQCKETCEEMGYEYLRWKIDGFSHSCYCKDGNESVQIW